MTDNERRFVGILLGAGAGLSIYGAEIAVMYKGASILTDMFQSPDRLTSTAGVLTLVAIMVAMVADQSAMPRFLITSGYRAGNYVYDAVVNS